MKTPRASRAGVNSPLMLAFYNLPTDGQPAALPPLAPAVGPQFIAQQQGPARRRGEAPIVEASTDVPEARRGGKARRRMAVALTPGHAARLRRFVMLVSDTPLGRDEVQRELAIGLRTFYRDLEFVRKRGIKVVRRNRAYVSLTPVETAETAPPFSRPTA